MNKEDGEMGEGPEAADVNAPALLAALEGDTNATLGLLSALLLNGVYPSQAGFSKAWLTRVCSSSLLSIENAPGSREREIKAVNAITQELFTGPEQDSAAWLDGMMEAGAQGSLERPSQWAANGPSYLPKGAQPSVVVMRRWVEAGLVRWSDPGRAAEPWALSSGLWEPELGRRYFSLWAVQNQRLKESELLSGNSSSGYSNLHTGQRERLLQAMVETGVFSRCALSWGESGGWGFLGALQDAISKQTLSVIDGGRDEIKSADPLFDQLLAWSVERVHQKIDRVHREGMFYISRGDGFYQELTERSKRGAAVFAQASEIEKATLPSGAGEPGAQAPKARL